MGGGNPAGSAQVYSSAAPAVTPAITAVARHRPPASLLNVMRLLSEPHDLDPFEHPDGSGTARVLGGDEAERPLIGKERLAINGIGDDDVVAREARIELGEREHRL